ncbi:MAG: hypothetical protein IIA65_03810 [Planctomycetes bacterium]|nr:hypothetical protein [Planctomycetota bacterium]
MEEVKSLHISELSSQDLIDLQNRLPDAVRDCESLEDAAQQYMSLLYETLENALVLARLFVTVPFRQLPEHSKSCVLDLSCKQGIGQLITGDVPVLSLIGSRGREASWNYRQGSAGHVGIPLASRDSIHQIPMISRLLKQMDVGLDWIESKDPEHILRTWERISGVFYVEDAGADEDDEGRKIISSQDFVATYGVKTVFGYGGGYLRSPHFFTAILFARETVPIRIAERFVCQANIFKTETMRHVEAGRIFNP